MDKQILRSVLVGLSPEQEIQVTFIGARRDQTGTYRVVNTRRGRGKGGSRLADLQPLDVGDVNLSEQITIGTPDKYNDFILNVTVDGEKFGYDSESEVPANYETNAEAARSLKEQFRNLLDAAESRPMVEITASQAPEVNGNFTVINARQLRGRGGQIVLTLQADSGDTAELWSYRHSGVVEKFAVVGP